MEGQQRPCDPEWLLAKFRELDVFPPGFVLKCPVCNRQMPPASVKGSAQLLQCQHLDKETGEPTIQMAQDGKCYTINTRGVAFGGPNLKDFQDHIDAWGRTPQGMECLARWRATMSEESEASYWATLAENKRLVEAGAAQQAARQIAEQQAGAGAARVGTRARERFLRHFLGSFSPCVLRAVPCALCLCASQPWQVPLSSRLARQPRPVALVKSTKQCCQSCKIATFQ